MRTAMLADRLLERGHSLIWWASAFEHQQKVMVSQKDKDFDCSGKYTIRVLRGCGYRKNVCIARYIDHMIVAHKFRAQSGKYTKPDVIIASMPDHLLAYEAGRYASANGIPFVVDIRDLWPDILLDRAKTLGLYCVAKRVLARDSAKLALLLKNADSIIAVSQSYLAWGLEKIGRVQSRFDRVFYLGYKGRDSKDSAHTHRSGDVPAGLRGREEQKLFLFIGTFGVSYELELIVDAARRLENSGRADICFVLAGTGEKLDAVHRKASGLKNVVLLGWIGEREIAALLRLGYAGLLSYVKGAPQGLPNKPFEYLSAGLPVINSLEGEMADLVDRYQCGLNYLAGDLDGLCHCVERLASDPSLRETMSRNASGFFAEYCDADSIYREYTQFVEDIVASRNSVNRELRPCNIAAAASP